MHPDLATIQALRRDLALQLARHAARAGQSQVALARSLDIPQPTLSKIINGQVTELSLELLIRIAVRAGLPLVLQTGTDPAEAGVYVSATPLPQRAQRSGLAEDARAALSRDVERLTPTERLEAQWRHSELVTALQKSRPTQRASKSTAARRRPS